MNIINNKKARFNYIIQDTIQAGMVLHGGEIKMLRNKQVSLDDSFAVVRDGEIFLLNMHIAAYPYQDSRNYDSKKSRKLLLKRHEINRLIGDVSQRGITLVPLRIYINDRGYAKVEIGLAKNKNVRNKKQALREKDITRELDRELRGKY